MNIKELVDKIYTFNAGTILEKTPKPDGESFFASIVNGDTLIDYLVFPAGLGKDREGVLIYILTNVRIIRVEIDNKEFQSAEAYLKDITSVERNLLPDTEGNNARIRVIFPSGKFGLLFPSNKQDILDFFQKLEAAVRNLKQIPNGPEN